MIGIQAIGSYIPAFRESNYDKKDQFEIDDQFINEKIGVKTKAVKAVNEETSDLCCKAFEALAKKIDISPDEFDCIIVCTQNPDGNGIPHSAAIVHGKIGAKDDCAAFDIGLGCSGYVYSLSVATSFMNANGMKKGLLFSSDPYSKIINPNDKDTSLLFGDAATVTLLGENPIYQISNTAFGTKGIDGKELRCVDGRLQMNGRAVFGFSMLNVPPQIKNVVSKSGYKLEDIDVFILHQGSKYLVDMLTKRLGLDPKKVPSNLEHIGNTVSSSIPLLLEDIIEKSEFQNVVISGFGVGLSFASAILSRIDTGG